VGSCPTPAGWCQLKRKRGQDTPRLRRESTVSEPKFADDHFQKLALERLGVSFKEMGIKPPYTFKVTVPFEVRAEGLIRQALYRRRRGRTLELETANVIRTEVRRLAEKHADPKNAASQYMASAQFWPHLKPKERYARYRVVLKDHKKTVKACLDLL
jgi:hypothetical protein